MDQANLPAPRDDEKSQISDEELDKCLSLLGLTKNELSKEAVKAAWKRELVDKRDTIGRADNHDLVASINNAKDTLLAWLES